MLKRQKIKTDLCVIGGGMAGICAAISAARQGIKVVLMHERPVLGGNASSEIRMWVCGAATGTSIDTAETKDCRETGIIEEIELENLYRNPTKNYYIWDSVLYDFVLREKNITLLLNCTCMDAETEKYYDKLHEFLFESVYKNPVAKSEETKVSGIVEGLIKYFFKNPEKMPEEYLKIAAAEGKERAVTDYIAGMTDHYAVTVFSDIYIPKAWSI